jgi:ferredoxin
MSLTTLRSCGRPGALAWGAATRAVLRRWHGSGEKLSGPTVPITFHHLKDDSRRTVEAYVGENLLEVAHRLHLPLEGACEGSIACSTCHCIFDDDLYDELPEPEEDEDDMLDLAFALTPTSRLGCQVVVTEAMADETVTIPAATTNFYVDGHVPTPH